MPLQFKNIAVGNLQDDVSGNNYAANKAVYILNLNNTLAQIFSDEAGTIPIVQDGVNNVTGARGVFGFWVEAGDYFVQVGANKYRVSITGADYFNNRVDETVNLIVDSVAGRGAYYVVGSFEAGFTYTDINQVGTFGGNDYYVYTGGLTNLSHPVPAGTDPTLSSDYAQVFYGEIDNVQGLRNELDDRALDLTLAEAQTNSLYIGQYVRLIDLGNALYKAVAVTDSGGFYQEGDGTSYKLRLMPENGIINAKHAGAKDDIDYDFNEVARYCVNNNLTLSYFGCKSRTSTTIDVTSETGRILKIVGDVEDKNNTGVYNLTYTGTGVAINCKEIIHNRFGLAGTVSVVDPIPVGTTGIQAAESITHIDSCLRNFDTHYRRNGGFYHTIEGGTLRRGRILHDITGTPAYNAPINATHSDFEVGVTAGGGNGPIVISGSWEKFTEAVFKSTTTASKFGVHLDSPYIENYPTEDIAAGLTSTSGKYQAAKAIINGDGTVTGFARISCNGITDKVFDLDQPACIDLTLGLIDQGNGFLPTTMVSGRSCRAMEIKTSVDQGDFSAVDIVSAELANSLNASGYYQDFDGKVICPTVTRTNELVNSWVASEGFDITVNNGTVTLSARLDPTSATSTTCFSLVSPRHRPEKNLRFTGHTNSLTEQVVEIRVLASGNILVSNLSGDVPTASRVSFCFSYNI